MAAYQELEKEGQNAGLEISEEKTKHMVMTENERRKQRRIKIGNRSFEEAQEFKYLRSRITKNNETREEI